MHTLWIRLNAIIFFSLSLLLLLSLLSSQTSTLTNKNITPTVHTLRLSKLKSSKLRINGETTDDNSGIKSLRSLGGVDRALLSIDLNVDLTPAFHWNVHQIFCFVVAEYKSKSNVLNSVVLYDKIVLATHDPVGQNETYVINEKNLFVKYALMDQYAELRGVEVELKFYWDVMPITSGIYGGVSDVSSKFFLPSSYR